MKLNTTAATVIVFSLLIAAYSPFSYAEKPHGPKAIEVSVTLGTTAGEMKFVPDTLTFERGNYYKLVISNPRPHEHYFTSDAFATHIFTRKIEVLDRQGETIAELHGSVNDIELKPGAHLEWFFFPMTKGQNLKLLCHKKGHEAQGMLGSISIIGDL